MSNYCSGMGNDYSEMKWATVLASDVGLYLPDYAMKDVQNICN